jgi:hypothetical protein
MEYTSNYKLHQSEHYFTALVTLKQNYIITEITSKWNLHEIVDYTKVHITLQRKLP